MDYLGEKELLQYFVKEWRMEKTGANMVKAVLKVGGEIVPETIGRNMFFLKLGST